MWPSKLYAVHLDGLRPSVTPKSTANVGGFFVRNFTRGKLRHALSVTPSSGGGVDQSQSGMESSLFARHST